MKFDLDTAWKDALNLLRRNLGLLAVIAGVFFFLPYAVIGIALPGMETLQQAQASGDPEAMLAAVGQIYQDNWYIFLALAIVQGTGLLAMLALVRRRAKPTVGEALGTGARSVVSYILTQAIQALGIMAVATLIVTLGAMTGLGAIAYLALILALALAVYIFVRLSLAAPVIAIEGELNPLKALRQSWALTAGSGTRLLIFYALLLVAFIVVSSVLTLVLGLVFALAGEQAALFGEALVSGFVNATMIAMLACILAAVHTQMLRRADDRGSALEA